MLYTGDCTSAGDGIGTGRVSEGLEGLAGVGRARLTRVGSDVGVDAAVLGLGAGVGDPATTKTRLFGLGDEHLAGGLCCWERGATFSLGSSGSLRCAGLGAADVDVDPRDCVDGGLCADVDEGLEEIKDDAVVSFGVCDGGDWGIDSGGDMKVSLLDDAS